VVPAGQPQRPAVQVEPPLQVTPQAPQLALSVCGSTQAPAQAVRPAGHTSVQVPIEHDCAAVHALPQRPQLVVLVCTFTHTPPHTVVPGGHTHAPRVQTVPPVQVRPQEPQFVGSVCVLRQRPPQDVCPIGQDDAQAPMAQVCVVGHALPQRPQLVLLD
jgi:hypothetical protein